MIACAMQTPTPAGPVPHAPAPLPIMPPGAPKVLIGGAPAACVGDKVMCATPAGPVPNPITKGSTTVQIGGKPAARVGDMTAHGGSVTGPGCATVQIGG